MDDRSTQVCFREVRGARQVSSSSLRLRFVSGRFAVYVRSHLRLCWSGLFQGGSRCTSGLICGFCCSALECTAPAMDEIRPHRFVSGRSAAHARSYLLSLPRSARLACAPSWMTGPHGSVSGRFAVYVRSHLHLCCSALECTAPAVDEARPHRSVSGKSAARARSYLLSLLRSARLTWAAFD